MPEIVYFYNSNLFFTVKRTIMSEQLQQIVQQAAQGAVVNNREVPDEQNEAVTREAQASIQDGLKQLAQTGELQEIARQVQSGQATAENHPAVQQITNQLSGNLMQKFGLSNIAAGNVAGALIPSVLGKIFGNAGSGNSGLDLGNLIASFTGGSGGFMDKASALGAKFGLDKDGDGDVDFNDIKKMI